MTNTSIASGVPSYADRRRIAKMIREASATVETLRRAVNDKNKDWSNAVGIASQSSVLGAATKSLVSGSHSKSLAAAMRPTVDLVQKLNASTVAAQTAAQSSLSKAVIDTLAWRSPALDKVSEHLAGTYAGTASKMIADGLPKTVFPSSVTAMLNATAADFAAAGKMVDIARAMGVGSTTTKYMASPAFTRIVQSTYQPHTEMLTKALGSNLRGLFGGNTAALAAATRWTSLVDESTLRRITQATRAMSSGLLAATAGTGFVIPGDETLVPSEADDVETAHWLLVLTRRLMVALNVSERDLREDAAVAAVFATTMVVVLLLLRWYPGLRVLNGDLGIGALPISVWTAGRGRKIYRRINPNE